MEGVFFFFLSQFSEFSISTLWLLELKVGGCFVL